MIESDRVTQGSGTTPKTKHTNGIEEAQKRVPSPRNETLAFKLAIPTNKLNGHGFLWVTASP